MSFPSSPTNGQVSLLNGISYVYNSTSLSWTRVPGAVNSTNYLNITGSTSSVSSTTGALVVTGGVGIQGDVNIGGSLNILGILTASNFIGTFTGAVVGNISGSAATATNIAGGNPGQILYQSATSSTSFVGTGTSGQVLVSYGSTGPSFTSTISLTSLTITGPTDSSSSTTGALQVVGGVGIGGSLYVAGVITATNFFAGSLRINSGSTLTTLVITGTNIVIDSAGSIQTSDYASDLKGWKISAAGNGSAEFENAKIRGTLSTAVFEKTSVNAVGGQLYVANSTTLTGSGFAGASTNGNYTPTQTTMSVENVTGFESGEILTAKKFSGTGFATEYLYVNSASRDGVGDTDLTGRLYVTRAYGSGLTGNSASLGESPSAAQSYSGSQVIVSTGKLNTGFIRINANPNDQYTPYIDIVERTGSGIYDVALKARLGDLSGLANSSYVFGKSNPGFGLATDNVFLQGGIIANTGSIGGINMASSKLFTGTTGTYNNPNTGFYLDATSKFSLKDKLAWDGTTFINCRSNTSIKWIICSRKLYISTWTFNLLAKKQRHTAEQPNGAT